MASSSGVGKGADVGTVRVSLALRDRLGHDATTGLLDLVDGAHAEWKDDVMTAVADRFERRLTEEISGLRVAITRELHDTRVDIIKWSFLFWVGQLAALAAIVAVIVRAVGR
jgi:hypothetical protein